MKNRSKLKRPLLGLILISGFIVVYTILHKHNYICYPTVQRSWEEFNNSFKSRFHHVVESTNKIEAHKFSSRDFNQLIDLHDFEFIKSPLKCEKLVHQPKIVIIVHSAPYNFNKRRVIRETWGEKDHRALLLFLIGDVNSTSLQNKLDNESDEHEDLVQGNFHDSYRNMTYKHVSALKWFVYNCPNAKYLLKTDDDVFVNTPLLYSYLETPLTISEIICDNIYNAVVFRNTQSKWYVTLEEYPDTNYPDYCMGYWVLYPGTSILPLYRQAQKTPYFWIDDVHVSGTVASKVNITTAPAGHLLMNRFEQNKLFSGCLNEDEVPFFFTNHDITEKEARKLWKMVRPFKVDGDSF